MNKLALYVHIPFCLAKCPYCDFASGPVDAPARRIYLDALRQEIATTSRNGETVRTIFFGGGTPSELDVSELAALVRDLERTFRLSGLEESTIECNPGTVNEEKLHAFRALGFNRLSLGVQSFRDRHLKTLGRIHDAEEARKACREARRAGFDNVSLDLIFAIPGQTLEDWGREVQEALSLEPEHLSLYNLTVEPGTEYGRRAARGELTEMDEETAARMFETAMDLSEQAGYRQYEISNFAKPGWECRHNLVYWRNEPYLGFGVGAASYLNGERRRNTRNLSAYATRIRGGLSPVSESERLAPAAAFGEALMLALRTLDGADIRTLSNSFRVDPEPLCSETIRRLSADRLIEATRGRIRLTRQGRLLADYVCAQFLQEDSLPVCRY